MFGIRLGGWAGVFYDDPGCGRRQASPDHRLKSRRADETDVTRTTLANPQISVPMDQVPSTPPHVEIHLLSQPRYLCGARDAVGSISRRFGFDEQTSGQLALAVDEALCNVIRHGYNNAPDRPITLKIWPLHEDDMSAAASAPSAPGNGTPQGPGGVRIVIEDEARQVDPDQIKSRDLAEVRPGGLGVHIIRQIMSATRFEKRPGPQGGMRLVMAKRLEPRKEEPAGEREPAVAKSKS